MRLPSDYNVRLPRAAVTTLSADCASEIASLAPSATIDERPMSVINKGRGSSIRDESDVCSHASAITLPPSDIYRSRDGQQFALLQAWKRAGRSGDTVSIDGGAHALTGRPIPIRSAASRRAPGISCPPGNQMPHQLPPALAH